MSKNSGDFFSGKGFSADAEAEAFLARTVRENLLLKNEDLSFTKEGLENLLRQSRELYVGAHKKAQPTVLLNLRTGNDFVRVSCDEPVAEEKRYSITPYSRKPDGTLESKGEYSGLEAANVVKVINSMCDAKGARAGMVTLLQADDAADVVHRDVPSLPKRNILYQPSRTAEAVPA